MPRGEEGPGWSEYVLPALRPMNAIQAEREEGFIIERAIGNFLLEHAPFYRRGDITDIVIEEVPMGGGFVNYRTVVAFTKKAGEQV